MHLVVNGWFAGQPTTGSGQYTRALLQELDGMWEGEITVLLPGTRLAEPRPFVLRAAPRSASTAGGGCARPGSRIRSQTVSLPSSGHAGKVWFEQIAVPRAAARLKADVLHVPYFGGPVSSPVPLVVTVHDLIQLVVPQLRGGAPVRAYNLVAAVSARRAGAILTDSDHARSTILRRLRLPPERVRRVYLAAEPRFSPDVPAEQVAEVRRRYALPERFLLYAGGLDWRKNVAMLIRAYAASDCPLPLAVAGDVRSARARQFPDLPTEAMRAGVPERVRFLGWVEEDLKPALYRAAHAFIFPSRYEGFGLTPLEAMACGTPVLCSNATSLPEVTGDAALLFDPDDEAGLATLIRRVTAEPDLHRRLAAAGPRRARRFSWRATAEQTVTALLDVAMAGRQPR